MQTAEEAILISALEKDEEGVTLKVKDLNRRELVDLSAACRVILGEVQLAMYRFNSEDPDTTD